ncbi:MAG: hypothetical protein CSB24_04345 [Deltaproteobacteria bacterium]|nr:MAG: hypothetical protein CSB24_04345 [Deltaproteobacteria bacterium]
MLAAENFFSLADFPHPDLFDPGGYVWLGLERLKNYMDNFSYPPSLREFIPNGEPLPKTLICHQGSFMTAEGAEIDFGDTCKGGLTVRVEGDALTGASVIMAGAVLLGNKIELGSSVLVESGAMIKSPAIIGDCTEIRQGAYLRGYTITGRRCIIGHTTEVKHSIFFNDAKAGHFNYIGDSIIGTRANLGAGTKLANLRFIGGSIKIRLDDKKVDTGRKKLGAILGEDVQTGCNSVTSPGTLLGKGAMLMPCAAAKSGFHPAKSILR